MLENGYIKLYRSMLKWEWYDDINTKVVFLHLLLTVSIKDSKWHGIEIKRGSRIASYEVLAKETKLTMQQLRTAIKRLESTGELTRYKYPKFTVFALNNYDKFQTSTSNSTDFQQASNKEPTSFQQQYKKVKEDKEDKEGEEGERETLPPENKQPFGDFKNVFLKDEEYKSLKEKFGIEFLNQEISSLSTFMESNGKNYSNHYAVLLRWCLQDFEKFKDKNKYSKLTGRRLYEFDIAGLKDFEETYECFLNNFPDPKPTEEKQEEEPGEEEPETKSEDSENTDFLSPEEMDALYKKFGIGKYKAVSQEQKT